MDPTLKAPFVQGSRERCPGPTRQEPFVAYCSFSLRSPPPGSPNGPTLKAPFVQGPRERCPGPTRQEPEPRMHGPREGPGPSGGLPRWPAGGSPKCHTVVQRSHFGGHFGTPFGGRTCTLLYKKLQNGSPKSCQNRPSWAGAWGAWVLAVFIESLQDQPLIKTTITQAPQAPAQEGRF